MELTITLDDLGKRAVLFGLGDRHLRLIKGSLGVQIAARESSIKLSGSTRAVGQAATVLEQMQHLLRDRDDLHEDQVAEAIARVTRVDDPGVFNDDAIEVYSHHPVSPKTAGQKAYVQAIRQHDLVFCLGPAGTGKTYLAVAMAVSMLKAGAIQRVILVRPAVEAGEKLGFLPGDMQAKVNPYLRPLFDAMADMMSFEQTRRLMTNDVIEVAPLAFMRGRTLNSSAIILDEAQNTTCAQMLMFLTRLGHYSKMIVTGDDSQVDLERPEASGLIDALRRLSGIGGVAFIRLDQLDIVRHRLVQNIVNAYANGKA
ncbi:MAG TPA: PhoH family protein [Phycisphaerae bacterium]|nr:PhoH family protein [Phycisphaerae bacterium]